MGAEGWLVGNAGWDAIPVLCWRGGLGGSWLGVWVATGADLLAVGLGCSWQGRFGSAMGLGLHLALVLLFFAAKMLQPAAPWAYLGLSTPPTASTPNKTVSAPPPATGKVATPPTPAPKTSGTLAPAPAPKASGSARLAMSVGSLVVALVAASLSLS
ncbi:hypothetical protein U1Q18_035357 [Sarracenia purpurea var. burkii]